MILLIPLLHVLVCVFLILVVLLQTGKGADLAGAFGGGGSQTAFGARGATTLLHKLTTASAVIFMATSLTLAVLASRPSSTVVQEPESAPAAETTPATDAPAAGAPAEPGAEFEEGSGSTEPTPEPESSQEADPDGQ